MRPVKRKELLGNLIAIIEKKLEQPKANVRVKVEHLFYIIKNIFGLMMVRYKRVAKD